MANKIQIKRSTTNAAPTGLANGELAYTANGEVLFVGHPDGTSGSIAIGGKRFPGTLTANQALVANSTSGIDKVIVANLTPSQIYANGAVGSAGQVLTSGAAGNVYWTTAAAGVAGANTQVMFNNSGVLAGDAGFTYDLSTQILRANNVTVANTLYFDGGWSINQGSLVAANATTQAEIASFEYNSGFFARGNRADVYTISANSQYNEWEFRDTTFYLPVDGTIIDSDLINTIKLDSLEGFVVITNTHQMSFDKFGALNIPKEIKIGTQIQANGSYGSAGQVLTSGAAGNVYWTTPTTGTVTSVTGGNGLTGSVTTTGSLDVGAGAGISVSADAVAVLANSGLSANATGVYVVRGDGTLTVNATGVYVNTANLSIATSQLSGDVALGTQTSGNYVATITAGSGISGASATEGGTPTIAVVANNGIVANSGGVFAKSANGTSVDASGINVVGGNGLVANSTGVHAVGANGINVAADSIGVTTGSTLTVNATGIHVNSTLQLTDLTISGNLDINGTLTTVDTTNLSVTDSIISLARGQTTANTLDIGFYGTYGNAKTTSYSGLFRDATDGVYRLFAGQIPEPTTTVDTANVNFAYATLQAYLTTGALVANSSAVNITANSSVAVALTANTLSLTTALPATSGGTGQSTYAVGDLLVGGAGNTLAKLTVGTDGKVLQSNGTSVVYADLDGGTF